MLGNYTYLALMIFTFLGPFVMSFEKNINFKSKWKNFIISIIPMMIFFITWDILFTINRIWEFNPDYYIGFKIFHLPLEEWLFFIFVPFACLFIYENVKFFIKKDYNHKYITIFLIVLMLSGLIFLENGLYTQITFISLLMFLLFTFKKDYLSKFYISYLLSLLPFFIVNGVLTATPVVIYNNAENLSIRIGTIPVEDTFYGLLMMLQVVYIYEILEKRK